MSEFFRKFSSKTSYILGSPYAFLIAISIVIIWWLTGPIFGYSDMWQLAINTGTTIITFLMVFLIQNTQNRDSRAIHLKLDELIKGSKSARNKLLNIEDLPDSVLEEIHQEFTAIQSKLQNKEVATQKTKHETAKQLVQKIAELIQMPHSEEEK